MRELPPPLPPERRTVGQLVAEAIRAYGARFWRALPLGLPLALATQLSLGSSRDEQAGILLAFAPLVALAYVLGCSLVLAARPTGMAFAIALLIFLPVPVLVFFYVLPALAWLALFGLAVPAALVERLGFRAALRRGRQLGLADYVHALGSLCALVIVVVVSKLTLVVLLRTQGGSGARAGHLLADLVLSPLLYVGAALLYLDQAARLKSRRDADLRPPVEADPARRPDAPLEP